MFRNLDRLQLTVKKRNYFQTSVLVPGQLETYGIVLPPYSIQVVAHNYSLLAVMLYVSYDNNNVLFSCSERMASFFCAIHIYHLCQTSFEHQ